MFDVLAILFLLLGTVNSDEAQYSMPVRAAAKECIVQLEDALYTKEATKDLYRTYLQATR